MLPPPKSADKTSNATLTLLKDHAAPTSNVMLGVIQPDAEPTHVVFKSVLRKPQISLELLSDKMGITVPTPIFHSASTLPLDKPGNQDLRNFLLKNNLRP